MIPNNVVLFSQVPQSVIVRNTSSNSRCEQVLRLTDRHHMESLNLEVSIGLLPLEIRGTPGKKGRKIVEVRSYRRHQENMVHL